MTSGQRLKDLIRFYDSLARLEEKVGGRKSLADCHGRMAWPQRGVYFFMEEGENRTDSGTGQRIVRVGTHALTATSRTRLWQRLSQHRGTTKSGGGNHRGSIFRLIVGTALDKEGQYPHWDVKNVVSAIREAEIPLEKRVSKTIGAMPLLWLCVKDAGMRDFIEKNSISLLSNAGKEKIDAPSMAWLGHSCTRERVRESGLWNQNYVEMKSYDPEFLGVLDHLVDDV